MFPHGLFCRTAVYTHLFDILLYVMLCYIVLCYVCSLLFCPVCLRLSLSVCLSICLSVRPSYVHLSFCVQIQLLRENWLQKELPKHFFYADFALAAYPAVYYLKSHALTALGKEADADAVMRHCVESSFESGEAAGACSTLPFSGIFLPTDDDALVARTVSLRLVHRSELIVALLLKAVTVPC
jgi:hypothetical protein